jgi:4-carboxymuconolactone decarboxylase
MTLEQRLIYDEVVSGPRGQMVGPLRAAIHSPELARRWSQLGEFLRYGASVPPRLGELAILVTARRWTSQVEWLIHARAAEAAGLPAQAIEDIRLAAPPRLTEAADREVYEFARQLQQFGRPNLDVYEAVARRLGARGVVELTAVIGYYTLVAMTLNAHEIPVPEGAADPLRVLCAGLPDLPPMQEAWA